MEKDLALALNTLVPGAKYVGSLTENTKEAYDLLEWEDEERAKPTWAQIQAAKADPPKPQQLNDILAAGVAAIKEGGDKYPAGTMYAITQLVVTLERLQKLVPEDVYIVEAKAAIASLGKLPGQLEVFKNAMLAKLNEA